jgi:hypothetical protein
LRRIGVGTDTNNQYFESGATMASDDKPTKAKAAPAKETPVKEKAADVAAPSTDSTKTDGTKTEGTKTEGTDGTKTDGAAPANYSRGEGQKPVTKAYKDNWDLIFKKNKKSKKK